MLRCSAILSVCLSVTGGHRKLPWPRNLGRYIQARRSLDTSGIVWPRALGLLLPTVALSTFVSMRGVCKVGSWSSRWRLTVSDRNVNMRKTLLWQPWRWMATKFSTSAWRVISTIVAEAKLMSYFRWSLMAEPDDFTYGLNDHFQFHLSMHAHAHIHKWYDFPWWIMVHGTQIEVDNVDPVCAHKW